MSLTGPFWQYQRDGREFAFTRRDLKQPWKNFLVNDRLQVVINQTGKGPAHGTRSLWVDHLCPDANPRTVFLRDRDSGALWHANGTLGPAPADWKCVHGFNYSTISATQEGIAAELMILVPVDDPVELWRVRLRNVSGKARRLQVVPLILWRLGWKGNEAGMDDVSSQDGRIWASCRFWPWPRHRTSYPDMMRDYDRIGCMAASLPVQAFDCQQEAFVGEGSLAKPDALAKTGKLGNSVKMGSESVGALEMHVDLAPGAETELVVVVAQASDRGHADRLVAQYASPAGFAAAEARLTAWWDEYLGRQRIETPDADINQFANGWNRFGLWVRHFNRFGYRDTAQDMAAFASFDRERGRRRLEAMYGAQWRDGWTYHDVWFPGFDQHRSINGDVPAWMPWATAAWVRETGDWQILEGRHPFVDGGDATAYEHCKLALERLLNDGKNSHLGLPMLRSGDWNDCLCGSSERGVSVWLAEFLVATLRDFAGCARGSGRDADAAWMLAEAQRLSDTINRHCWDGAWYHQAYDDEHQPIGSAADREGRIFLMPQTWAVLSGVASPERARQAMESVEREMDTPVGIPLLAPPFTQTSKRAGLISRMAPGYHHNGGSWNHAVTWAIIAECRIGRPDRALELYQRLLPAYLAQRWTKEHISEPYMHTSYTNTPASGETGRTGVGWNTGTVCWIWRCLFDGFAGIEPTWEGLRIAPALPKAWDRLQVVRRWRDTVFTITIEDPQHAQTRVKLVEVDGKPFTGGLIPATPGPGERRVRVVLG